MSTAWDGAVRRAVVSGNMMVLSRYDAPPAVVPAPDPLQPPAGWEAREISAAQVFDAPPSSPLDALVAQGFLSQVCGDLFAATVSAGRNILFTGDPLACREVMGAIGAALPGPAVVTGGGPCPEGWLRAAHGLDLEALGALPAVVWGQDPEGTARVLGRHSGVLAWVDAGTVARALVRLECTGPSALPEPHKVLAAVDLVAVVSREEGVQKVVEVAPGPEGYRIAPVLARGVAPVPAALTLLAAPGLLDDVAVGVYRTLGFTWGATTPLPRPVVGPPPMPLARAEDTPVPSIMIPEDSALAPGWEIEGLPSEAVVSGTVEEADRDGAAMAASYGLGPPPAPSADLARTAKARFGAALDAARAREDGDD